MGLLVDEALDLALRDLEQPATASAAHMDDLKNELDRLETELIRYAEAIAHAGPLATILEAVKVREQRIRRDPRGTENAHLAETRRSSRHITDPSWGNIFRTGVTWHVRV
jgi:hypothetical protein